jgi:hypothetical protein
MTMTRDQVDRLNALAESLEQIAAHLERGGASPTKEAPPRPSLQLVTAEEGEDSGSGTT